MAITSTPRDADVTATADFVFADVAMFEVLLELARNYKGIDPVIDARIDAMASVIANDQRVTFISPHNKGAPRVPLYLEGEPGQGKSSLVEAAAKKFCEICGLNYIEEPEEGYVLQPTDFYYVKVNLSGAQNKSDFGGMMIRTEAEAQQFMKVRRKAADAGSVVLDELVSRSKALASFSKTLGTGIELNVAQFDQGSLDCVEIKLTGDQTMVRAIAESIVHQVSEESKARGVGMAKLSDSADAQDDRVSYSVQISPAGATVSMLAPRSLDAKAEYASAVLPSVRFAKFKKARFGLVNFDDVANANENIRNILLEVLQKGRYTGTMDIGNAYVTLSGNQGAEDGTNVMSRMSDAELTRMRKLNVRDRPEDWAKRVTAKYLSEVGDCYFASFIHRHGQQEGIFREPTGQRGKRGERKTNGRALENALEVVSQHFMAAKHAGISVAQFRDRIKRDIKDCAGARVAAAFDTYLHSMVTEAIPLAENLINLGKWNVDVFNRHSAMGRTTSGQDFCFRFGAALGDSIVNKVAYGDMKDEKDIKVVMTALEVAMERACTGMSDLVKQGQSTVMNYTLSHVSQRLMNLPRFSVADKAGRKLSTEVNVALGVGFSNACASDTWGDEATLATAEDNYVKALAGSNISGMKTTRAPKR